MMSDATEVVKTITIRGRQDGVDETTASVVKLTVALSAISEANGKLEAAWQNQSQRMADMLKNQQQFSDLQAANDNANNSFSDLASGAHGAVTGLSDFIESALTLAGHLKLLAAAAYAGS